LTRLQNHKCWYKCT